MLPPSTPALSPARARAEQLVGVRVRSRSRVRVRVRVRVRIRVRVSLGLTSSRLARRLRRARTTKVTCSVRASVPSIARSC